MRRVCEYIRPYTMAEEEKSQGGERWVKVVGLRWLIEGVIDWKT